MMGLLGKMTGSAAVTGCDIYVEDNGRLRTWVQIKALGVLGMYVSDLEARDVSSEFMIMIWGKPIPVGCVGKSENCSKVLEVNVAKAWKEMGLEAGWSNEVSLEVFMH